MENRSVIHISLLSVLILQITSAFLLNGDGVVKPDDPYVYFGETLVLWCNLTNPEVRENSTSMFFQFDGKNVSSTYVHIINTRSIQLRYPVTVEEFDCLTRLKYYNFVCLLKKRDFTQPLDHQKVQVNYKPKPVKQFDCRVYNWENMTCTWNLATPYCNYDDMNVSLVWAITDEQFDCPKLTRTSCSWSQYQPDFSYLMMVLIKNNKYNNSKSKEIKSDFFKIYTDEIVQPAPVENLIVQKDSKNSRCLTATWSIKLNHRKRQYKVELSSGEITKMILFNSPESEYHLCDLHPYTLYSISVSNMPMLDDRRVVGYWSNSVETAVRTPEDIPDAAPILSPGFTKQICQEINCQRNFQIYWKRVEKKYRNGIIDGYMVEMFDITEGITTTNFITDGNQTSCFLSLTTNNEHRVTITAKTRKGYSTQGSSITIPSIQKIPGEIDNLIVEAVNKTNTKSYSIKWFDGNKTDSISYTLYYCTRPDVTTECRDEILWIPMNSSRKHTLFIGQTKNIYQFGVGREVKTDGNVLSSGIQWNKCVFIKDTKPNSAPPNLRFSDLQPDRALLIEWDKLDCLDNIAYITKYLIQVCKVTNRNGNCKGDARNITADNNVTNYMIRDLKPLSMYKVTIQAVSSSGLGPTSSPISSHVTDNSLKTGEIAGIVIGALFVLSLVVFAVFRCIRCAKNEKKTWNDLRISPPELLESPVLREADKPSNSVNYKDRPLPPTPSVVDTLDSNNWTDSGFHQEENPPQYEPIKPVRQTTTRQSTNPRNNDSITSETFLINNMEAPDDVDHHHLSKDTSPYAVSDVTRQTYPDTCDSDTVIDSYTQLGLSDSEINNLNTNLNNFITPHKVQTVGFTFKPQNVPITSQRPVRPQTISNKCSNHGKPVPLIPETENSDSSDDCNRHYVPNDVFSSPISEDSPIVCELVSPSGDIHNTQTLLIRRTDPMRPLSDYLHQLPLEYFQEPDQNQPGPTTEL